MKRLVTAVAALALAAGCSRNDGPPVVATDVVVTAPAAGMPMAAGYLRIGNRSGSDIRITRVSSPEFGAVEMHETIIEDGVARMRAITALEIANGDTMVFEPGGKHLMLMQPFGEPRAITLNFYSGDELLLSIGADFTAAME
jgi:copper(I)-binding protein